MQTSKYSHQSLDLSNHNVALSKIFHLVKEGSRVIDFGCSSGYLAKELLEKKKCRVTGVDIHAEDLEVAQQFCEQTFVADLDGDDWLGKIQGTYDYVVFADVLEHLKYPLKVLERVKTFLAPGGRILISIPNIAHASIRLELLQGSFEYEQFGILDDTHLKYWTKDSFLRMANKLGLFAEHVDMVQKDIPRNVLEKYTNEESLIQKLREPDALAYQYIFALVLGKENVISQAPKPLWETEEAIKQFYEEISERDRVVQARERAIAELTGEINQREESIGTLTQIVRQKEAAILELSQLIQQKERDVAELDRNLQQKELEVGRIRRFLQEKDQMVLDLDAQLKSQKAEVIEFEVSLEEKERMLGDMKAMVVRQEAELEEVRQKVQDRDWELQEYGQLIEKREQQLQRLMDILEKKNTRITELNSSVKQQEGHIDSLNKAIAFNTEKISSGNRELSQLKQDMTAIQQSFSYKLGRAFTYPVRMVCPIGSKRSVFLQAMMMFFSQPLKGLKVLNRMRIKQFFQLMQHEQPQKVLDQVSQALRNSDQEKRTFVPRSAIQQRPRIAVLLHLYYLDLWPEMLGYIQNIDAPFDLYVNLVEGSASSEQLDQMKKRIQEDVEGARVFVSENRGRDMGGFVHLIHQLELEKYDVFCKIHTKKSFHRQDGDVWRKDLMESVLGKQEVGALLDLFALDDSIGLIGSGKYYMDFDPSVGTNHQYVQELARRLQLPEKKVEFIAGSIFWGRVDLLKEIHSAGFTQKDFTQENGAIDGNLEHAFERIFGSLCSKLGYRVHKLSDTGRETSKVTIKPICFYLPQFHAIPENDQWWGEGFTEWTNVGKAESLFDGHQVKRPHADIGNYDLLEKKIRKKQGEMAKQYGVYGFAYHHYWFKGKKLLEKPLELMLEDGYPDLPFCLNWANEPWTRTWDGLEKEILQPQEYGDEEDWKKHFEYLLKFFQHPKYIKVNEAPVFSVYRLGHIPQAREMIDCWRKLARENGFPGLHIVQVLGSFADSQIDPKFEGVVDAVCEFQPNFSNFFGADIDLVQNISTVDMSSVWEKITDLPKSHAVYYRGGFPGWDNSPRRGREGYVFRNGSAENFEKFLKQQFLEIKKNPNQDENFFFINAWNEWGEGCVMEPDEVGGY
ncbi:MAG: glycoside hydrolase family 99-like domain-containing protein, partial [Candidatus Altimarinota bacterium]